MSKDALDENNANIPIYGSLNSDQSNRDFLIIADNSERTDPLTATIGNFGKWQSRVSILMALLKIPIAWFALSIVFLAPPTSFWCKPPPNYNSSDEEWLEQSKPKDKSALKQEGLNSGYCVMNDILHPNENMTLPCVYGYAYDETIFKSTIVSEWNLVCGHERLIDITQITLMLGILIGNIIFGIVADKIGRKPVLITCIFLQSVFGIISSWSPWYAGFILARFLLAISNGGTMVTSFVMCMEVVGGKWRTIVPILYQMPFGLGNVVMAGLAYELRDWRLFHMGLSLLASLFVFYIWCIPESPRWLIATGKREEAAKILREAAAINKRDRVEVESALVNLTYNVATEQNSAIRSLFCTKELKKRSFLLFLNWTICGITFYAFSQYLGNIGKDMFLTVAISGLVMLPGTIICIFLVDKFGRRWTIALAHTLMAFCFLAINSIAKGKYHDDWPRILLAGCGILGLSVSMPALYLFTGELYPTVLRNGGVGVSIMFSRIGSMLAPLIITLEEKGKHVPLMILAVASFTETILILPLSETKGQDLPETIEDLERKTDINMNNGYRPVAKNNSK